MFLSRIIWDDHSDEYGFLGALLAHPDAVSQLDVRAEDFGHTPCRTMFLSAVALRTRGAEANIFTLTDELRSAGELAAVGGAAEVTRLATEFDSTPTLAAMYLTRMRHKWAMRQLSDANLWFSSQSSQWGIDPATVAAEMTRKLDQINATCGARRPSKWEDVFSRGTLSGRQLRELEIIPRAKLLDDWLAESDLGFLFAARGVEKTWLALLLAIGIADNKKVGPWNPAGAHPVLYVDGEMPLELIQTRNALLAQSGDNLHYINHEWLFEQNRRSAQPDGRRMPARRDGALPRMENQGSCP